MHCTYTDVKYRRHRLTLAAEQNFLAWIRTGLALMGFGFVVARFGLFLQEIRLAEPRLGSRSYGVSIWSGTAMIALGVAVNVFASWRHVQLVRELNRGGTDVHQAILRRPSLLR